MGIKICVFKLIFIKRFSNWTEITHYFSFLGDNIKNRYIPEKISLGVLNQMKSVYIIGIKEIGEPRWVLKYEFYKLGFIKRFSY